MGVPVAHRAKAEYIPYIRPVLGLSPALVLCHRSSPLSLPHVPLSLCRGLTATTFFGCTWRINIHLTLFSTTASFISGPQLDRYKTFVVVVDDEIARWLQLPPIFSISSNKKRFHTDLIGVQI